MIHVKVPPKPKFSEDYKEKPIGNEMDEIIKQMQSQRNYDIEKIRQNNINIEDTKDWLKSKDTSNKPKNTNNEIGTNEVGSKLKYLNKLNENSEKKITFDENLEEIYEYDDENGDDNNILSFLKIKQPIENEKTVTDIKGDQNNTIENKIDNLFSITNKLDNRILKIETKQQELNDKIDKTQHMIDNINIYIQKIYEHFEKNKNL